MKLTISALTFLFMLQSSYAMEILAETNNSDNIRLNGKSYDHCVLFLEDGITNIDKKEAKFVQIGIGNRGEKLEVIPLFRIDKNGDYVSRWYYPDSDKIANKLSKSDLDYGYKFESTKKHIKFSNGSSCMSRQSYTIKLKNGNLNEATSVQWLEGMCDSGQFLLAAPSAIFGADRHGNDLKCKFD